MEFTLKPPFDPEQSAGIRGHSWWLTLWLAVTDSTPQNGCMRVIPGSHGRELAALQEQKDVASVLGSSIGTTLVDASRAADVVLATKRAPRSLAR